MVQGEAFEAGFRAVLAASLGERVDYFSRLRPYTELWIAERFAGLTGYHRTFQSCNRGFHIDPARRLDHWCGRCDKCCFIDLILAPFLEAATLRAVFAGHEPLDDRPCPGSRTWSGRRASSSRGSASATSTSAGPRRWPPPRPDRALPGAAGAGRAARRGLPTPVAVDRLRRPLGPHHVPDAYATDDLLV